MTLIINVSLKVFNKETNSPFPYEVWRIKFCEIS